MEIFLEMNPPTATHQMKKVRVVRGTPVFYEPKKVQAARRLLMDHLLPCKPDVPLEGPISLTTQWRFPKGRSHKDGEWRITRPDTDNLQKLLKDCMTACGYWKDDAQVVRELTEKMWSDEPCGIYIEIHALETVSGERRQE